MWGLGFWDLLIIAFVLLLVFGTRRLPHMARSMGESIRGFKDAITEHVDKQDAEAGADRTAPAELPPAQHERDTVV